MKRYLSLMKYAQAIIGNSSSGILEAPAFHVPTVNIGDRQKGRLQAESVINCSEKTADIVNAINAAVDEKTKSACKNVTHPYGDGKAAKRIAKKCREIVSDGNINIAKEFYNTDFNYRENK